MDAAGHDGQQKQQGEGAAQDAQFLADGGEDEVGVLGGDGVVLEHGAVEEALARDAPAGEHGHGTIGVPADALAVGVDAGVPEHQDPVLLVVFEKVLPEEREGRRRHGKSHQEPPGPDAAHA